MTMLNIGGSTKLKNYVKFNAKAGRWLGRGADGNETEIDQPTFVADFENLATGWQRFREGQPPERVMDPGIGHLAPCPGEDFKRGFVVMVYSPRYFGGTAELSSSSLHLCNAIKDMFERYEAGKGSNPGKLPVIACTGSQSMKDRYGTNYRPVLSIVNWVDRPADLPSVSPVDTSDIWQGTAAAPAKVVAHVPATTDSDVPF